MPLLPVKLKEKVVIPSKFEVEDINVKIIKTAKFEKAALFGLGRPKQPFTLPPDAKPFVVPPQRLEQFVNKYKDKAIPVLTDLIGLPVQKKYKGVGLGWLSAAIANWFSNNYGYNKKQKDEAERRKYDPSWNTEYEVRPKLPVGPASPTAQPMPQMRAASMSKADVVKYASRMRLEEITAQIDEQLVVTSEMQDRLIRKYGPVRAGEVLAELAGRGIFPLMSCIPERLLDRGR